MGSGRQQKHPTVSARGGDGSALPTTESVRLERKLAVFITIQNIGNNRKYILSHLLSYLKKTAPSFKKEQFNVSFHSRLNRLRL